MSGCAKPRPLCRAFVGLGGNIGDPAAQLAAGLQELARMPGTRVLAHSSLYRSAAVGTGPQPDYLNAVAQIETGLAPGELLDALLAIERRYGRTREFPNAPRTLDLDVLMYENLQCHEHGLTLPHPRMHERLFVLLPLLEIAPGCSIPGRGPASDFAAAAAGQEVVRLP